MKVGHRIRQEVAGAFRSLRYDLTRRSSVDQPRGRLAAYAGLAVLCAVVCIAMFSVAIGGVRSLPQASGQPVASGSPSAVPSSPSGTPVVTPAPADTFDTAPGQLSARPTERGAPQTRRPVEKSPTRRPPSSSTRPPPSSSPPPSPTESPSPSDPPPSSPTTSTSPEAAAGR